MGSASLFRFVQRLYRNDMPIARQPGRQIPPVERPVGIEQYEGRWVAVLHGEVIASALDDRALARELRLLGPDAQDAVMQFVRPPVAGYIIGVG